MQLQILNLLCSLFVLVLATSKLKDKLDIDDLFNTFNLFIDRKKYSQLGKIFISNVTYDSGPGKASDQLV